MDFAGQRAEPTDLTGLSDKKLILRYCENRQDDSLADELWRRHNKTIYDALQKCSRGLCPTFRDPRDLVHDTYTKRARANLLNRICGFDELDSAQSLKAWLFFVARSAMLDERRELTQSRRKRKIIPVAYEEGGGACCQGSLDESEDVEESLADESLIEPAEPPLLHSTGAIDSDGKTELFEPRTRHVYFRSLYSTSPLDPAAPIEEEIVERERKFIFRDILAQHATNSDEDAQCSSIIRLRFWRKWPVNEVVGFFYGGWATQREFNTKYQACRRLLRKNYDAIIVDLERTLGVKRPEQI